MTGIKAIWSHEEELECVSARHDVSNVMTFSFKSPSGAAFSYDPGQFLTFELPVPGETVYRTYTISSSPTRPTILTVTVKAQPDSIGTRWMHENVRAGTRLRVRGPGGKFTLIEHPAKKYLFISAGSGVTPMMSMTMYLYDQGHEPDIVFVNCARLPSEIIFRDELEYMSSRVNGIRLKWIVEQVDSGSSWTGYEGRICSELLEMIAPDFLNREVFCCGPAPFMSAVRNALQSRSFNMAHYHEESFQAPVNEELALLADVSGEPVSDVSITFALSGLTHKCSPGQTVLNAAHDAGLRIPTGCTMGLCGTCRIKVVEGEVVMNHNGGIDDDDIEEGYILACCSKPIGNLTVEI